MVFQSKGRNGGGNKAFFVRRLFRSLLISDDFRKGLLVFSLLLLFFVVSRGLLVSSWGPGANYRNYSVRTTVNVTNAYPEILNVSCTQGSGITLTAGSTKAVSCLIQARDYNGGDTIVGANATFHFYLNSSADPDDNNVHYTNSSCSLANIGGIYYSNWTCIFDVWYYANNGSWRVNATVIDDYGKTANAVGNATILPLLALNVTETIDFGQLPVTNTSGAVQANVTNLGNRQINVTVYGFGGDNETTGAGLAMKCEQRNITLPNERYALSELDYDSMTPLTGSPVTVNGLTLPKQIDPGQLVINSTYWRLHVNLSNNPYGVCNGTVVFAAISP